MTVENTKTIYLRDKRTFKVKADVQPENAIDRRIAWTVSNPKVATVAPTADGATLTLTGTPGKTDLTATSVDAPSVCDTVPLDVRGVVAQSVAINCLPARMVIDDPDRLPTARLTAIVKPDYAYNKRVAWGTGDSKIASVDDSGLLKAVAPGNATVTATTLDGGAKDSKQTEIASTWPANQHGYSAKLSPDRTVVTVNISSPQESVQYLSTPNLYFCGENVTFTCDARLVSGSPADSAFISFSVWSQGSGWFGTAPQLKTINKDWQRLSFPIYTNDTKDGVSVRISSTAASGKACTVELRNFWFTASNLSVASLSDMGFPLTDGVLEVKSDTGDNASQVARRFVSLKGGHTYGVAFQAKGSNMSCLQIAANGGWDWNNPISHNPSDDWTICRGTMTVPNSGHFMLVFFINGHSDTLVRNLRIWDLNN